MPLKSPFFDRTSALCTSMNWKEWAGYHAVSSYETLHDVEYYAFRYSAGLLDITPLFKYSVIGPDASAFLSRIMVKDISKLKVGRVTYCCWCNDDGKVIDDGTVMRRGETEFFVTSADPCFSWFSRFLRGYDVLLTDVSYQYGALALQGPTSRDILKQVTNADLDSLTFFSTIPAQVEDFDIYISRTGYTGDLGYELWVENSHALKLWDAVAEAGRAYDLRPAGLNALDVTRVEAGLILKDVDYFNALHVLIPDRMSSPYEISLGWTVNLARSAFNGQKALRKEKEAGSQWAIMGLDIDWEETEELYNKHGLPPEIGSSAWRSSIPLYADRAKKNQIGYATSGTWSPILKKNIALVTLKSSYATPGTKAYIETTVEHIRYTAAATVSKPQFFNPARKTFTPNSKK